MYWVIEITAYLSAILLITLCDVIFFSDTKRENSNSLAIRCLFATTPYKDRTLYPLYRYIQFQIVVIVALVLWYYFGLRVAIASIVPHFFESFDLLFYCFKGNWQELIDKQKEGIVPYWLNYCMSWIVFKVVPFRVWIFALIGSIGIALGILIIII